MQCLVLVHYSNDTWLSLESRALPTGPRLMALFFCRWSYKVQNGSRLNALGMCFHDLMYI